MKVDFQEYEIKSLLPNVPTPNVGLEPTTLTELAK